MITKQVIDNVYKKYHALPSSPDKLNLALLFEYAMDHHDIYVDEGNLVIDNLGSLSPFHTIPLSRIHGIVEFERSVAIVLRNAIIFLNKRDSGVNVHLREHKMSLLDRVREKIARPSHPNF